MPEYSTVQHGTVLGSGGVACERCGADDGFWGGGRAEGGGFGGDRLKLRCECGGAVQCVKDFSGSIKWTGSVVRNPHRFRDLLPQQTEPDRMVCPMGCALFLQCFGCCCQELPKVRRSGRGDTAKVLSLRVSLCQRKRSRA